MGDGISPRASILNASRMAAISDEHPYNSLIRSINSLSCGVNRIVVALFMQTVYPIDICMSRRYTNNVHLHTHNPILFTGSTVNRVRHLTHCSIPVSDRRNLEGCSWANDLPN